MRALSANDRGETFTYAMVTDGIMPGVLSTNKQYRGGATPGGVNANALKFQSLTDYFGSSPVFYSVLSEPRTSGNFAVYTLDYLGLRNSTLSRLGH